MITGTFKKLHTEGVLTVGDTLTHPQSGDWVVQSVYADGTLIVKQGETIQRWQLDLPPGCHVRQLKE